jgi:hypothetical protein
LESGGKGGGGGEELRRPSPKPQRRIEVELKIVGGAVLEEERRKVWAEAKRGRSQRPSEEPGTKRLSRGLDRGSTRGSRSGEEEVVRCRRGERDARSRG